METLIVVGIFAVIVGLGYYFITKDRPTTNNNTSKGGGGGSTTNTDDDKVRNEIKENKI